MTADPVNVSLSQEVEQEALSLESVFQFHCHDGLACFNQCCRTPTIVLSPYDLLRLKNFLGITSGEFLPRYTLRVAEEFSNLPLVFIDPYNSPGGGCPFVGADGCTVYAHRPAACRLFPLTMGSRLTPQGVEDYYFCRRLDYCRGFEGKVQWTVASWQANQGFAEYDQGRREWLEILLKQGLRGPLPADGRLQDHVATVAYDLDRFRQMIMEPAFQRTHALDGQVWEDLALNDLALLRFSYKYLKALLFE